MSINERLVMWLRRIGQADRTVLDLLLAAMLIGLIGAVVFGMPAHGQTADKMITVNPTQWTNRVIDVQPSPFRACVAGYHRGADRYGGWMVAVAWVDFARLTSAQIAAISAAAANGDLIALAGLRTVTTGGADDAAAQPCRAKLVPPPPVWRVATLASGQRPAYALGAGRHCTSAHHDRRADTMQLQDQERGDHIQHLLCVGLGAAGPGDAVPRSQMRRPPRELVAPTLAVRAAPRVSLEAIAVACGLRLVGGKVCNP